jgi:hypothetical protein
MFYRLKTRIKKGYFASRCKGILDVPPVGAASGGPVILSQLVSVDLVMYLVAVKSLYTRLGRARIVVLLDKDWSDNSLELLNKHVRPWRVLYVKDRVSGKCPQGGTWERLLTIADLVETDYVIQLDADTVTLGPVPEVAEHIASGTSFMIGTWKDQQIEGAVVSARRVSDNDSRHVQVLAERHLKDLDDAGGLRYARGQSSFAGFAKGSFSVERLEALSERMGELLGKAKWAEWGSESFASNFCVANAERAAVLPWPRYASYNPERVVDPAGSAFLHFEGTNRFRNGSYTRSGRKIIGELRRRDARESSA